MTDQPEPFPRVKYSEHSFKGPGWYREVQRLSTYSVWAGPYPDEASARRPAPTGMVDQGARDELISRARWKAKHVPSPVVSALLVELADALTAAAGSMGGGVGDADPPPFGFVVKSGLGNLNFIEDPHQAAELRDEGLTVTTVYASPALEGDGWQWVPKELAYEMLIAGVDHTVGKLGFEALRSLWAKLLAAAPKPSAGPSENGGRGWWP